MTAITLAVVVFAYPVIAGWAYRLILRQMPPEPQCCDGSGRNHYGGDCDVGARQPYPDNSLRYGTLYCDACNEWLRWRVAVRVTPKSRAWLWPVLWIPALVNRLFDAGANIEATPARLPTHSHEQQNEPAEPPKP